MAPNLILSAPPRQAAEAARFGLLTAHMAYRLGSGFRLLRVPLPTGLRGGLMMIDDTDWTPGISGSINTLVQEVLRECSARGFTGVVGNWEQPPADSAPHCAVRLGQALHQRGMDYYVTEPWGGAIPSAHVLISSALTGGTLRSRISDAVRTYGGNRTVLAVERVTSEFFLPSPDGQGAPLSQEEFKHRLAALHPRIYYSPELCARYFTWQDHRRRARFVLFDDEETIRKKLALAQEFELVGCMLAYPEVCDFLPSLLGQP